MKVYEKLRLSLDIKNKRNLIKSYSEKMAEHTKRYSELETALEEADNDDAVETVRQALDNLETEVKEADLENKISATEAEIAELEKQLDEAEPEPVNVPTENDKAERSKEIMNYSRQRVRELLRNGEYYELPEVREFYDKFKNLRAVGGEGLTIPNVVVNRIMDIMGDFTTLYPLVDKIRVSGTTRILIDTDTEAATWMEQNAAISAGDVGTITNVDFDGFKVGKVVFVDNNILQDSIINIDDYVSKKIARAIAKALDKAIVKGEGASAKQPVGIIPSLSEEHVIEVTNGPKTLIDTIKQIALIDTGEDSVGNIRVIMNRKTYYNIFFEFSVQVNSAGNVVGKLPNLATPDVLGLPVTFNNNIDENEVLMGVFENYTLVERENIVIENSEHYKFVEDQMTFRGKGRFDGKPTKPDAFVLVKIVDTAKAGE